MLKWWVTDMTANKNLNSDQFDGPTGLEHLSDDHLDYFIGNLTTTLGKAADLYSTKGLERGPKGEMSASDNAHMATNMKSTFEREKARRSAKK